MMKRRIPTLFVLVLLMALLVVPVCARNAPYVYDEAELLTQAERERIEETCEACEAQYQCGVYIVTMSDYVGDAEDAAEEIYYDLDLDGNGILLLLSMYDRDYAFCVQGEKANEAFNDKGLDLLEEKIVPYLKADDFSGGLQVYADTCKEYLKSAAEGDPVGENKWGAVGLAVAISFAVSLIVCLILRAGMKNVHSKTQAAAYADRLNLTRRIDLYTHTTQVRTKIETKDRSNSNSRSGKF